MPILWCHGTGADVMRRIAAPMVGGVFTSFLGELVVFPAIYFIWKGWSLRDADEPAAPRIGERSAHQRPRTIRQPSRGSAGR